MMELKIQILSLIYSFFFGIFFAFSVNVHYKLLFSKKRWFQILMNFIFVLDMSLFYFLILKRINGGILHLYFYFSIFLGFFCSYAKTKKVRSFLKKLTKRKKML